MLAAPPTRSRGPRPGSRRPTPSRDSNGQLVYPNGFARAVGLNPVVVPQLATPLVYDKSRCFLVVRNDVAVDMSRDWHFNLDAISLRVKGRFAAAIPDPNKAIRKLAIDGARAATAGTARHTSKA